MSSFAQLSPTQKQQDFVSLARLFNKQYGPYEWKKQLVNVILLDVRPWIVRVAASKDDLKFLDLCHGYGSSLRDGHVFFSIPISFNVQVLMSGDIYDGKVLVESISQVAFRLATAPILRGEPPLRATAAPTPTPAAIAAPPPSRSSFVRKAASQPPPCSMVPSPSARLRRHQKLRNVLDQIRQTPPLARSRPDAQRLSRSPAPRFGRHRPPLTAEQQELCYSADDHHPSRNDQGQDLRRRHRPRCHLPHHRPPHPVSSSASPSPMPTTSSPAPTLPAVSASATSAPGQ